MKMKIKIKLVIFLTIITISNINFAAGINLMTDSTIDNVTFFKTKQQRDNNERSGLPFYYHLFPEKQYKIDAYLDGFYAMRWTNQNGVNKEAILNIAGITGWRNVKILSDDRVQIGAWGWEQPRIVNSYNY